MTAAQQHRAFGVSASPSDDLIIIQVGTQMTSLTPSDLRTFLKCAARALFRADMVKLNRELEEAHR